MIQLWGSRRWLCMTPAALSIVLSIALASIALAACGYSGSNQSGTSPTQPQPQAHATHPPVQVQHCGVVQGLENLKVPVADVGAVQVEKCFWHAFQQCHTATLVYILGSIDTTLIRTFMIHNDNGTCSISDAKQQRIVPNPPSAAETYVCAGLVQLPNGLHFSACGQDGSIFVPVP
jgi:hypothetical protein